MIRRKMTPTMYSAVADEHEAQADYVHGPPPMLAGPATRQIQNPQCIFKNYPEPVPSRFGQAFQSRQARDECPGIDLMDFQPAPQPSTTQQQRHASNYGFPVGIQQPNYAQSMHGQSAVAPVNGYYQPPNGYCQFPPNGYYQYTPIAQQPQPSSNVTGPAFQAIPAGQTSWASPQLSHASGSMTGAPSSQMIGNQTLQPSVYINGAAPWGNPVGQIPYGSYPPSANMAVTAPQASLVSQPSQPSVKITGTTPQGRSVGEAAHKGSPQVAPQALQSSGNTNGFASRGTLGDQAPHGDHQPSINIAGTGPQKSPDCQPSKSPVNNTGTAHQGTLDSQNSEGSHQSFSDRAVATLKQMLENQSPRRYDGTEETDPKGQLVSYGYWNHQALTDATVTAPQEPPVSQPSQPSVGTTEAVAQGESVEHKGVEKHKIYRSRVNGIRKSTSARSPDRKKREKKKSSPAKTQPPRPRRRVPNQCMLPRDVTQPQPAPPPPSAEEILSQNELVPWEQDMARYLWSNNVMGLYKIGDCLCDVHGASSGFVKLATRKVAPNGEPFWCHTLLGQRIHSIDREYLNGKAVHLSDGTFLGMEDSQGNMIFPKWQFTEPAVLGQSTMTRQETETIPGLRPESQDPMWF